MKERYNIKEREMSGTQSGLLIWVYKYQSFMVNIKKQILMTVQQV